MTKKKQTSRVKRWNVQFVGDYFTLQTNVEAEDDEQAIEEAVTFMSDHYGWDLSDFDAEADPAYDSDDYA